MFSFDFVKVGLKSGSGITCKVGSGSGIPFKVGSGNNLFESDTLSRYTNFGANHDVIVRYLVKEKTLSVANKIT